MVWVMAGVPRAARAPLGVAMRPAAPLASTHTPRSAAYRFTRCITTNQAPDEKPSEDAPSLSRTMMQVLAWVPVALFITGHVVSIASVKGRSMSVRCVTDAAHL